MDIISLILSKEINNITDREIRSISDMIQNDGLEAIALLKRKWTDEIYLVRSEFVDKSIKDCYKSLLLREVDEVGYAKYYNQMMSGEISIYDIIIGIINSEEFLNIALCHKKISEAALKVSIPLITGSEPSNRVLDILSRKMIE